MNNEETVDLRIVYTNRTQTTTKDCFGKFSELVDRIVLARKDGEFCRFKDLAINPEHILFVEDVTNGEK